MRRPLPRGGILAHRRAMNICVVGAGAIGGWVAARLALAGEQVMPLARGETRGRSSRRPQLTDGRRAWRSALGDPARRRAGPAGDRGQGAGAAAAAPLGADRARTPCSADAQRRAVVVHRREPLARSTPTAHRRRSPPRRSSAASSTPLLSERRPRVVVKHADKLILGEPGGGPSERISAAFRVVRSAGIRCDAQRQCAPRDLVQIVGQRDDQPAVGADPLDRRPAPRRPDAAR